VTRRAPARDAGETLVELLVTVVILGVATAGLSGALLAVGKVSQMHRQQVLAQAAVRAWAEQVSVVTTYTSCAPATAFPVPSPALPTGFTATVTSVRYWDGALFATTCTADTGIQRVALRVTAPNGLSPAIIASVTVTVRKPCVPTATPC
jgi:type II secretory pathway pseudopilin PulG